MSMVRLNSHRFKPTRRSPIGRRPPPPRRDQLIVGADPLAGQADGDDAVAVGHLAAQAEHGDVETSAAYRKELLKMCFAIR